MRIVFGVILVSGLCGGFWGRFALALPTALHRIAPRALDQVLVPVYTSYIDISNDRTKNEEELNEINEEEKEELYAPTTVPSLETNNKSAYLLIRKIRQRDKRYTTYLSFCHFKICNMGKRKRNSQMMNKIEDNEA